MKTMWQKKVKFLFTNRRWGGFRMQFYGRNTRYYAHFYGKRLD